MKIFTNKIRIISAVVLVGFAISVGFQNCSKTQFAAVRSVASLNSSGSNFCASNPNDEACTQITPITCTFNGELVANGQSVIAYQNSNGSCSSEKRVCKDGQLSGTFNYVTCSPSTPKACLFDGKTIDSGKSVIAYLSSNVEAGSICQLESRKCTDGALSGSYSYSNCTVSDYAGCLFDGKTLKHGDVITAYQNASVASGQTCQSEIRRCVNGNLTGTYNFGSCTVAQPSGCTFNGQTIAHGQTATAFLASTVPFGQNCQNQVRTCNNGALSGSYTFASCNVGAPASCNFNGQTVASGATVVAYLNSSAAYGASCAQEIRTCTNGTLSGSYSYANCSVSAAANCQFNGQTIAHGQNTQAFLNSTVPFGQTCTAQTRTCNNGTLSGSYTFASCNVGAPASCSFNGQTIASGGTVTGYQTSSVSYGQACVSETRTCNNGALSGGFTFASCNVGAPASCSFNGQTIVHGQSITAYLASAVQAQPAQTICTWVGPAEFSGGYGCRKILPEGSCPYQGALSANYQCLEIRLTEEVWVNRDKPRSCSCITQVDEANSCQSQTRTCNNGTLSGTYQFGSCSVSTVAASASCSLNGQSIPHGSGVTAYASSSVPVGQTCSSQYRTCNNGVLSGTYSASSCSVQQPAAAACSFNNQAIPHGSGVTAYASSAVPYGQTCSSEYRSCNNGTLSGTYTAGSCTAQQAASCPTQQSGALYCGSKTVCPDGTEVLPATVMSTTGTISGVAHGQYSNVTSTQIGSATNIRYRCDQGTFVWDPSGPTSCTAPVTYLPASDARCKKNCTTGFNTSIKCLVREKCQNGQVISATTQYPNGYFNITGSAGQTVSVSAFQVSIPGYTITRWDSYSATCDPNGGGNWNQGTLGYGYCEVEKQDRIPNTDYRCQSYTGAGDGG